MLGLCTRNTHYQLRIQHYGDCNCVHVWANRRITFRSCIHVSASSERDPLLFLRDRRKIERQGEAKRNKEHNGVFGSLLTTEVLKNGRYMWRYHLIDRKPTRPVKEKCQFFCSHRPTRMGPNETTAKLYFGPGLTQAIHDEYQRAGVVHPVVNFNSHFSGTRA